MRKNDVRKWIHAGLDLLPLLIIPVFGLAVRSDNNFQPIEVNYGGGYEVTPKYQSNVVNDDYSNLVVDNLYYTDSFFADYSDDLLEYSGEVGSFSCTYYIYYFDNIDNALDGDEFFIHGGPFDCRNNPLRLVLSNESIFLYFEPSYENEFYCAWAGTSGSYVEFINCVFSIADVDSLDLFSYLLEYRSMGVPEYTDFNYYEVQYNEGIVFNDTDVGSQMVYTLYNACAKYFNFNNVFNFNQIYDWLELNIFHGTAPMSIFIAWNIFLYEFLMDLIFLLYALFMFFVDFCSNLIDRFHTKCSGGK